MDDLESMWAQFDISRQSENSILLIKKINHEFCKYCSGSKVLNGDGFPTCIGCGISDEIFVTDTAEWLSCVDESGKVSDPSRCGAPQDLDLFSSQWGTASVLSKSGKQTYASRRAAKINFHLSMNHRDRALFHAYKDIDEAAKSKLGIPDSVVREAKILYRQFNCAKLTRGAVRTGIKANCLLVACKMSNIPRTTKEIADAYGIPTKDVSRTADMFKTVIMTTTMAPRCEAENTAIKMTHPADVIPRLMNQFNFGDNRRTYTIKCNKLCKKVENCVELMGKTPVSIASVIMMIALDLTKQDVCKTCKISMPTLNKIDTIIKKYLEELDNGVVATV